MWYLCSTLVVLPCSTYTGRVTVGDASGAAAALYELLRLSLRALLLLLCTEEELGRRKDAERLSNKAVAS